jgi:steroid 5-alpha reductase family enzyme
MVDAPPSAEPPRGAASALAIVAVCCAIGLGVGWAGGASGVHVGGLPLPVLCVALAFVLQWLAFVPAYALRSERFYDLMGGATYLSALGLAVAMTPDPAPRAWLIAALVGVWSVRLASFLFLRVHHAGKDSRFDEIKQSAPDFLVAWTLQGLWVSLALAAALAAITSLDSPPLGAVDAAGVALWGAGFGVEVIADAQKRRFRRDEAQRDAFIHTGLWAWSRHPNYFGEIVLWVGVALIATPTLTGWGWLTWVSPVFVFLLLTRVSGVPLLERSADQRWGGTPAYEAYKARTPVLVPRPPRRG